MNQLKTQKEFIGLKTWNPFEKYNLLMLLLFPPHVFKFLINRNMLCIFLFLYVISYCGSFFLFKIFFIHKHHTVCNKSVNVKGGKKVHFQKLHWLKLHFCVFFFLFDDYHVAFIRAKKVYNEV